MIRYFGVPFSDDYDQIIVGKADEIRAIYKSLYRAWKKDKSGIWPTHLGMPAINKSKIYGICFFWEDRHDHFQILNEHTLVAELLMKEI